MARILIVEDDENIAKTIRATLSAVGYESEIVSDGANAVETVKNSAASWDVVLLDVMLPTMDGFEVMRRIAPCGVSVIFLTAMQNVLDKVNGLKLGAEDYISKPFEIAELLARVETVLRRYHKTERRIRVLDIEIDTYSRAVLRGGEAVELTNKEYELLLLLVRNKIRALYRETIYENVWGSNYLGDSRTVDLHVQRLRRKMNWEDKIKAVYKVGYRLEV